MVNKLRTGKQYLAMTFAAEPRDDRTVNVVFSNESQVDRWFGKLTLDHAPGAVRMDRLKSGAAALWMHNQGSQIGVIETASIDQESRQGLASIRFGKSGVAEALYQDVLDKIVTKVSVGFMLHKLQLDKTEDEVEYYSATDWEPFELSFVSVPAIVNAQVQYGSEYGSNDWSIEIPVDDQRGVEMSEEKKDPKAHVPAPEAPGPTDQMKAEWRKVEGDRIRGIGILAARHKFAGDVEAEINSGISVADFAAKILASIHPASQPLPAPVIVSEKNARREYSYRAAILGAANGVLTGYEAEVHQDLGKKFGLTPRNQQSVFVPLHTFAGLDSITATKGVELKRTEYGEMIELLRNMSIVARMGARMMTGLNGPVTFNRQTGAGTAFWVGENPGFDVADSTATLGTITMNPKTLMSSTSYSRQLLIQSSMDVEGFVREDLSAIHALAIDRAAIHGSGVAAEPAGIYVIAGVNTVAMGGVPTYGKLIDMQTEVAKDNAIMGNLGYISTPGMAGKLMQTLVASAAGSEFIWRGPFEMGTVAGYKAGATNQVSSTLVGGAEHGIIFGNWNDLMIGMWGVMELIVDPYRLKKQGMIEVTSFQMADVAIRHPESFTKATGATV